MTKVAPVDTIDRYTVYKILSSNRISDNKKAEFIKKHSVEIEKVMQNEITKEEFKQLMENRPLIRFRPLKNSFTKQGDDKILAQALYIDTCDINKYINSIMENNFEIHDRQELDRIEKAKQYVYRHGTKPQVKAFLEYELSDVKTVLKNLYRTMEDNSGGLADYFSRPIHRMDNSTLQSLYRVIEKSLDNSYSAGAITQEERLSTAQWALIRIYQIQNNSRLIRAYHAYQNL